MISCERIREAVDILVREARPERIILFDSNTRGQAGPESDVDLLVVERKVPDTRSEIARLRHALSPLRLPVDVVVTTSDRVTSAWADYSGSYLYDAAREGETLYVVDGAG
jgi:predicted nucleotidyltransferase